MVRREVSLLRAASAIGVQLDADFASVDVSDVVVDSRQAHPGAIFVCVPGEVTDGHLFAGDAVRRGAVAVVVERPLDLDVCQIVVPDARSVVGPLATAVWDHPEQALTLIGVTGTNGKTSVVTLLEQFGAALNRPIRSFGTLTGGRTTPEACDTVRALAQARTDGIDVVAMEVSSHALALDRVRGLEFNVAVFTNLGRDHLDFHADMEAYFQAKASLFTAELADRALVNVDDPYGRRLAESVSIPVTTYSLSDAANLAIDRTGSSFWWRDRQVRTAMIGEHSVSNLIAAMEICNLFGVPPSAVATAAAQVKGAPGRFELVPPSDDISVIVDYAHSPDGLEAVLAAARRIATGKVSVVFGCGGDRDQTKRPEMGRVAATLADSVIVTADNPRSEDPAAINEAILAGIPPNRIDAVVTVPDRAEAIEAAITQATHGDVVVIAGKGHETTQTFADRVVPFEDRVEAARSLRLRQHQTTEAAQ